MKCTELGQLQIIETPADGPPEYSGFIDQNTYCYRMQGDTVTLRGIILGPGWENREFRPENLSCYKKGEIEMPRGIKPEKPSDEELRAFAEREKFLNLVNKGKKEFKVSYRKMEKWLHEAGIRTKKTQYAPEDNDLTEEDLQTPPEPEQAANQEPERESGEPAPEIIAQEIKTGDKPRDLTPAEYIAHQQEVIEELRDCYEGSGLLQEMWRNRYAGEKERADKADDELQQQMNRMHRMAEVARAEKAIAWGRGIKTLTYHKAEETPRRREPWEEDCIVREQVESWLLDTYRMDVSKARKMEILGKLLDLGVGA